MDFPRVTHTPTGNRMEDMTQVAAILGRYLRPNSSNQDRLFILLLIPSFSFDTPMLTFGSNYSGTTDEDSVVNMESRVWKFDNLSGGSRTIPHGLCREPYGPCHVHLLLSTSDFSTPSRLATEQLAPWRQSAITVSPFALKILICECYLIRWLLMRVSRHFINLALFGAKHTV